jgi:NAD(P)-dependent dehydrogenase (short-subunit alcohol dehydrogenase family)
MTRAQIAIVTGAAGGIGGAIAERLAHEGARLLVTDLDQVRLDDLAGRFDAGQIIAVAGDITDPGLPARLVANATAHLGAPTALVNCSGWLKDARLQNMPADLFGALLAVNFTGPMRLIDAVLPGFRRQHHGRIVSLASRAWLGNFGSSGYSAAKGALAGATRALAVANAPYGITVNCIAPGFIDTPMSRSMPPDIVERVIASIPVGRAGTVEDVGALVSFLLGNDSGYITGQTILACGGRSISGPITKRSGGQ